MTETLTTPAQSAPRASFGERGCRRLVLARLAGLRHGRLVLRENGEERVFGGKGDGGEELSATLAVRRPRLWPRLAFGGGIGAAEAYMDGDWQADDLTALVRLMLRNREVLSRLEGGWGRLADPWRRLAHRLRANTRRGSRANIRAHYDLGNEFFRLFLDERMMYSCALFDPPGISLDEASLAKLERVCAKLALGPGDHVLEIGTGWGGFALHAAERYGCRVTTTSISPAQCEYARRRVAEAGLRDRVTVLSEDYRDLEGRYDKLVSIEMIEAVGLERLETFFGRCSRLLVPGGSMLLQAITIADRLYERVSRSVDFIQRYIFPGGALPSVGALTAAVARATDLTLIHLEDLTPHYAETLARWRRRFLARRDEARRQGFSEAFCRMWEYYFCYCEGGFRERSTGDVQMLLVKPGYRGPSPLGVLTIP